MADTQPGPTKKLNLAKLQVDAHNDYMQDKWKKEKRLTKGENLMSDNKINFAKCNRCGQKLGEYENYALHTIHNRNSVRVGDILLCDECSKELLMDAQLAHEELEEGDE